MGWRLVAGVLVLFAAAGFAVFVPVDYGSGVYKMDVSPEPGSLNATEVPVRFSENVSGVCGVERAGACTVIGFSDASSFNPETGEADFRLDFEVFLPRHKSVFVQYVYCSHEKMHVRYPGASHGGLLEMFLFMDMWGWHSQCVELALEPVF